jgi:hypothetical protein
MGNFFYYHYHNWDAEKIEKGLRWKQRREKVGGGGNGGERENKGRERLMCFWEGYWQREKVRNERGVNPG